MLNLNQPLLTEIAAAELLGTTPAQLATWRRQGAGPEWLCIGHRIIRYEPAALGAWLAQLPDGRNDTTRHG